MTTIKQSYSLRKVRVMIKTFINLKLKKIFLFLDSGLNDLVRLILVCSNASLKIRHLKEWINLYYETFANSCKKYDVTNPLTLKMTYQMFHYHYPSELLFSYIILLNHYARATDPGMQTCLLGRMISGFEFIRRDYEKLVNNNNVETKEENLNNNNIKRK